MSGRIVGVPLGRLRDAALGLGYLALILSVGIATWLFYNQAFVERSELTLVTGTIGNALQKGSDVKLNGVPVGQVTEIRPRPGGAELTLALQPEILAQLSDTTTARLLPKTLFGERYVALVGSGEGGIEAGATIAQDASDEAVELEEVFDELLPVLQSIQPDKLSAMLGELAQMLRDNGAEIGDVLVAWGDYLHRFNPLTQQMTDDLASFGRVLQDYALAAPDLVHALDTMTTTSATLVDQQQQISQAYATVTAAADNSTGWMVDNSHEIIVLSDKSRAALGAVSPYASQFPCLFASLRDYIPVMEKQLGKGTDEPGLHVVLNVVESRGKYLPGRDAPTYLSNKKPRCPYQPVSSRRERRSVEDDAPGSIPAPPTNRLDQSVASTGLGPANSVSENHLIAELMAPTLGLMPTDLPTWSSLLLGPLLRGAEVELR